MSEKTMMGYPSIDEPWRRLYKPENYQKVADRPKDVTLYRYFREHVFSDPDFQILKYFNHTYTTAAFLQLIEKWARAFKKMGVKPDEMVPVFGTWCPEIAVSLFALNAIGAHPYFEKLDITEEALRAETAGARFAMVFNVLWNPVVEKVFSEDRFEKVIIVHLYDSMRFPLKQVLTIKDLCSNRKATYLHNPKFITVKDVYKLASEYEGEFEEPFCPNRIAVITSSSGTTSAVVKGIMDTNEGVLGSLIGCVVTEPNMISRKECYTTLPPTASTALNCFCLLPLARGMSIRIDPRIDAHAWMKSVLKYKPSYFATTGSIWLSFARYLREMKKKNQKVDLSFADYCIMGGSGVTPGQLQFVNDTLKECGARYPVTSGYGCSEFFGVVTVEKHGFDYQADHKHPVISVGPPIVGATIGIFDENDQELPYGVRGEVRVKGASIMHGYFGKPELSKSTMKDGWLKIGDIGEIDSQGYLYCYGRMKSCIMVNGKRVYLFDIANTLREDFDLEDCMVEVKHLSDGTESVVVYFVQKTPLRETKELCMAMDKALVKDGIIVDGYREFSEVFPISPTTLKPQTRYLDGFVKYDAEGIKTAITYQLTDEDDILTKVVSKA